PFLLPAHDRLDLELVLVLREWRRIALFDRHAQIDQAHSWYSSPRGAGDLRAASPPRSTSNRSRMPRARQAQRARQQRGILFRSKIERLPRRTDMALTLADANQIVHAALTKAREMNIK